MRSVLLRVRGIEGFASDRICFSLLCLKGKASAEKQGWKVTGGKRERFFMQETEKHPLAIWRAPGEAMSSQR